MTGFKKPTLDEMAIEYETYPFLFPDWEDNDTAQGIRWNMLQEMLRRFPEDAVFAAIGRAIDIVRLMTGKSPGSLRSS